MNFILHFCELHSDNSINDKNNLFENYIPKCYIVKRILISFNCFSEYSYIINQDHLMNFINVYMMLEIHVGLKFDSWQFLRRGVTLRSRSKT